MKQKNNNPKIDDQVDQVFNDIAFSLTKIAKYSRVIHRKNQKLLNDNYHRIGKIITCHLVIERLIFLELIELNKVNNNIKVNKQMSLQKN